MKEISRLRLASDSSLEPVVDGVDWLVHVFRNVIIALHVSTEVDTAIIVHVVRRMGANLGARIEA